MRLPFWPPQITSWESNIVRLFTGRKVQYLQLQYPEKDTDIMIPVLPPKVSVLLPESGKPFMKIRISLNRRSLP